MKKLKSFRIFENNKFAKSLQTYNLYYVKLDIQDICLELSDEASVKVWSQYYKKIKFKDKELSDEVLVVDITGFSGSLELTTTLFETLERVNRYCKEYGYNMGVAEMYLPFEEFKEFIIRLQGGRNTIGSITIIIY